MTYVVHAGDALEQLKAMPDESVHCCVTSPPYWGLRDYGVAGQIGLEASLQEFLGRLVAVFEEVRRVLRKDGTCWVNMGDCYVTKPHGGARPNRRPVFGLKHKDLVGQPWRLAFALQDAGWLLRQDIIWHKPNPMPESVTDRCTKAHEYLFMLSKGPRYHFDADAIAEQVADTSRARWAQARIETQAGSGRVPGKANGAMKAVGGPRRPQAARAVELARKAGLTEAHIEAIRAVGITDAGKARVTQDGCGKNEPAVQALADEAKVILGGYYREFLIAERRNKRSVWSVGTMPFKGAHFATFPPALVRPCILAGCPEGGMVLDPFTGSGTTGVVALQHGRQFVGIELNPDYAEMARQRIATEGALSPVVKQRRERKTIAIPGQQTIEGVA